MRKVLLSLLLGMLAVPLVAQEYQLVFADEFDGNGRPDSTIWGYEQGFVRNHEAQWYQADNAYLHNGMLVIEARQETGREGIPYTSASLNTKDKYSFLYGRLEVCARIPTAGGAWPAIWTLGNDMPWPSCGEIDLMEYYRINRVPHI
jgi:beta-glucanase (GH16 family)